MKSSIIFALLSALALPAQADDFDPYVLTLTGHWMQSSDGAIATYVGDFNGDGFLDLFVVNSSPCAPPPFPRYCSELWYGSSTGFTSPQFLNTANRWHAADGSVRLYVGDFNGDGRADLLLSVPNPTPSAQGNIMFYGTPTGFTGHDVGPLWGHPLHSADGSTQSYVADFNGDGRDDVLRGYVDPNWNAIWYSTGSSFTDYQLVLTGHPLQGNGTRSYVADFNGDGKADLLRGYVDPTWNAIFYSTGSGFTDTQLVLTSHPLQTADGLTATYIGDFNGDGKADVLRGYADPSWNAIWYSTGSGFTDTQLVLTGHPLHGSGTETYVADFNGDGKADVLRGYVDPNSNAIFYSTGTGFTATQLTLTGHPLQSADGATRTYVGDFNGDGRSDVLRGNGDPAWNVVWHSK